MIEVRREPLRAMLDDEEYGRAETTLEGYPPGHAKHDPSVFVEMFCKAMRCDPETEVTRIRFVHVES